MKASYVKLFSGSKSTKLPKERWVNYDFDLLRFDMEDMAYIARETEILRHVRHADVDLILNVDLTGLPEMVSLKTLQLVVSEDAHVHVRSMKDIYERHEMLKSQNLSVKSLQLWLVDLKNSKIYDYDPKKEVSSGSEGGRGAEDGDEQHGEAVN
jgi:hypothetical protein